MSAWPFSILAFGFLSPLLMGAGAAATSIPIIIHLLNKRKFRIVVWAAMDWLLAAQRRNARRLKFQRWLLLALRCLAILIIAAGIAQLVLQNSAIGSFLGEQRAVVIVWDDSYSMGYQQNGPAGGAGGSGTAGTAFERSRQLITNYISKLRSADEVLVIRAGSAGPLEAANLKPTADHQSVISLINAARPTDAGTNLSDALDRARLALVDLESKARSRQLLLITDFTNSSIHDPKRGVGAGGSADNRIEGINGEKLKKAAQGAITHTTNGNDFHMIDMGVDGQSNMAVTGLITRRPVVVAGTQTDLQVEVFNASDQPKLDVEVTLQVDGVPQQTVKIAKVEPGSFQTVTASVTVSTIGRHLVEAKLAGDLLPVDDTRRLMLNVRKEIPVLLVDGSPGDGGKTSYGSLFYMDAAYAVPEEGRNASMFAPKIITELELPTTPLSSYDVIVLSDTNDPGPAVREELRKFVEGGGLLMIFPGARTNAQRINESFGEAGSKLLPATLGQPVKLDTTDPTAEGIAFDPEGFQKNAVMQIFGAAYKEGKEVGFNTVQTSQYLKLGVPADGSSEVVLRYAKRGGAGTGDAAIVMRRISATVPNDANGAVSQDGGTVVLFAGTADMSWNSWGAKPSYLPFMHELTFYAMGRATLNSGAGLTLEVNQSIVLPGEVAIPGPWIGPHETRLTVTQELKEGRAVLNSSPLIFSGTYAPATGDGRPVIAVNPETREADIRHVNKESMAAALGVDVKTILPSEQLVEWHDVAAVSTASWLGPTLIAVALMIFIVEALLALAFSTYR